MPNATETGREPAIAVRGLCKRFAKQSVLEDVTLDIQPGEVVAVIGPSGAGKSTLLRCVNYLQPFESGRIDVLGHRLTGTREAEYRRPPHATLVEIRTHIGMVFQTFNLFPHLTVLQNITLAPTEVLHRPRAEAEATAMELLGRVGLRDKASAYPRRLSGGQQQRVAICRALAMQPQVMLFDEPTSMLDPELVGDVLAVIRELAEEGMTMLLATHEMSFARDVADTVVFMAERRIVERGPAREVLTSPREPRTRSFLRRVLLQEGDDAPDAPPAADSEAVRS